MGKYHLTKIKNTLNFYKQNNFVYTLLAKRSRKKFLNIENVFIFIEPFKKQNSTFICLEFFKEKLEIL